MTKADVWMPLFIGDYLADTARLTTEQHGAYFLLMMDYWRNGPPPDNNEILQNIARLSKFLWKKHRPILEKFFTVEDGVWKHKRIDSEMAEATASRAAAVEKATNAANARWADRGAPSIPQAVLEQCPSPSPSPSPEEQSLKTKSTVELKLDGGAVGEKALTDAEKIEGVFDYWRKCMLSPKSKLDDKRKGVIRRALKAGYSPFDLCRAIRGCSLTPHNQGDNERGQKYLGIHVCLRDADQIDRFIANSRIPPKAPTKATSGQIPGWWQSDDLAKQQAALVGVAGPHPTDTRDTFHGRIRAAIENGGKPPAPVVATAAPAPVAEAARVEMTDEQKAARRAELQAALKGVGVKVNGNGIALE